MSKRRIDPGKAKELASERMDILMTLSVKEASSGNIERARRYVSLARKIGMKTKTKIPKDIRYCKKCSVPLVPSVTCSVRLRNRKVNMNCNECGSVRRLSYIKEQRT